MPILLGAKPDHTFSAPLGLLKDCHRRIERFAGLLARMPDLYSECPLDPEGRRALTDALDYFRIAGPLHTRDEEESVFPRLLALPDTDDTLPVKRTIAHLMAGHREAEERQALLERLGQRWTATGTLSEDERQQFSDTAVALAQFYSEHIQEEERDVIDRATGLLETDEQRAIGQEMANRRGLRRSARPL